MSHKDPTIQPNSTTLSKHEESLQIIIKNRNKNQNQLETRQDFLKNIQSKLKADVKKTTIFVNKIRAFGSGGPNPQTLSEVININTQISAATESSEKIIMSDLSILNLHMFIGEVVKGIEVSVWGDKSKGVNNNNNNNINNNENNNNNNNRKEISNSGLVSTGALRMADVPLLVKIISAIHQRYSSSDCTFISDVLKCIQSGFPGPMQALLDEAHVKLFNNNNNNNNNNLNNNNNNEVQSSNSNTAAIGGFRVATRLMCDFWLNGILPNSKFFTNIITKMNQAIEKEGTPTPGHVTINFLLIVIMICNHIGIELCGIDFPGPERMRLSFSQTLVDSDPNNNNNNNNNIKATIPYIARCTHITQVNKDSAAYTDLKAKCDLRRRLEYYDILKATEEERVEFKKKLVVFSNHCLDLCARLKIGVETRWKQLCEQTELQGDNAPNIVERREIFQNMRRESERFIVLTDCLTCMMGAEKGPDLIDLQLALKSSNVDQGIILLSSTVEFFNVKTIESINYYDTYDQRVFYEQISQLEELVPEGVFDVVSLAALSKATVKVSNKKQSKSGNNNNNDDVDDDGEFIEEEEEKRMETMRAANASGESNNNKRRAAFNFKRDEDEPLTMTLAETGTKISASFAPITDLLSKLFIEVSSKQAVDEWLTEFISESTKYFTMGISNTSQAFLFFAMCKKRLQKYLRHVPMVGQELLSYFARCLAILSKEHFTEMGEAVVGMLEGELQVSLSKSKSATAGYMRKTRIARYLCELVKFRVAAPLRIIRVFQTCLKEVTSGDNPHTIDVILVILQACASFLLRGGMTRARMEECLEKLSQTRARHSACFSNSHDALLDIALSDLKEAMKPNSGLRSCLARRPQTQLEKYLHHLLFGVMSEDTFDDVMTMMRKMPWTLLNEDGEPYRSEEISGLRLPIKQVDNNSPSGVSHNNNTNTPSDKCNKNHANVTSHNYYYTCQTTEESPLDILLRVMRKAHHCRWDRLNLLAEILADTSDIYPYVSTSVIDSILQDMRTQMTIASQSQRRAIERLYGAEEAQKPAESTPQKTRNNNNNNNSMSKFANNLNTKSLEGTTETTGLFTADAARKQQKLMIDLQYLGEMFKLNIMSVRAVVYVLTQILVFYPGDDVDMINGRKRPPLEKLRPLLAQGTCIGSITLNHFLESSSPQDYSRIRYFCVFIGNTLDSLVMKGSGGTSRLTPTLQLIIERLLARLYLLVHTKAKPLPLDLDVKLADTLKQVAALLYPPADITSNQSGEQSHQRGGKTGQAQFVVLADVDTRTLSQFNSKMDKEVQHELEARYTKREWLQMSKDKREAIRKSIYIEKLESGGPKNFRVSKGSAKGKTIAKLKLDTIFEKKRNNAPKAGDEIEVENDTSSQERPFFFPKTRQEALEHLSSLLTTSGPSPRGNGRFTTVQRQNEEEEIKNNLAVVPKPPYTQLARQAQWAEDLCRCFMEVTDNGGMLSPAVLAAAVSGVASEGLDVTEESNNSTVTGVDGDLHSLRREAGRRRAGSDDDTTDTDEEHDSSSSSVGDDDDDEDEEEGVSDESDNVSETSGKGKSPARTCESLNDEEEEEEEETSQMGPKAFGLMTRDKWRGDTALDPEEDMINRMMHQMLLQSTTRAMSGNSMDLQMTRKAEQRLTGSTYQSAVRKVLMDNNNSNNNNTISYTTVSPQVSPSLGATPHPSTEDQKPKTTVKFAVLRKCGANKVSASAIDLPISHKFVSDAQKDIAKTVQEREMTRKKTMELSAQQEKERYEDEVKKAMADEERTSIIHVQRHNSVKSGSAQGDDIHVRKDDRVMSIRFGKS